MRRLVTAALVVVSLVVAGLVGEFRDAPTTNAPVPVPLGRAAMIQDGQSISVRDVQLGQMAKVDTGTYVTRHLLIGVQVRATTVSRRTFVSAHCRLRRPRSFGGEQDGSGNAQPGEVLPVTGDVYFPESGLQQDGWLLFETTTDDLTGAQLVCTVSQALYLRSNEPVVDLGFSGASFDRQLANAQHRMFRLQDGHPEKAP